MDTDPFHMLLTELANRGSTVRILGAESCTGGGIGAAISAIPGSSAWFWASVVVYDNEAKVRLLGVPEHVLMNHGAVSSETLGAMLDGLEGLRPGSLRYAVTGIAGPGGGSPSKPVGLVWIGVALGAERFVQECHFQGERNTIQAQAVHRCGEMMVEILSGSKLA